MSTFLLQTYLNKKNISNTLKAFEVVRGLSESELETFEILSSVKDMKTLEQSINESKKGKVMPIESIL